MCEYKYLPYIINAEFDDKPEYIDGDRWMACATVDIGDSNGPRFPVKRWQLKLIKRPEKSLGYDFLLYVCSSEYRANPEPGYERYVDIMHIQEKYNPSVAGKWLLKSINAIGEVNDSELTERFHKIFNTDDWDFDLRDVKRVDNK